MANEKTRKRDRSVRRPGTRPSPRRVAGRAAIVAGLFAASLVPGACLTLESIERGTCGNAVIDEGEDCDSFDLAFGEGLVRCAPPGAAKECRFDCATVEGVQGACPDGWACGDDDVCRGPSGVFASSESDIPVGAQLLLTADFDGDRADLLAVLPADMSAFAGIAGSGQPLAAHFFDSDGDHETTTFLPASYDASPSVGDLSDDQLDDVAVNFGVQGISVYRGRDDRSFATSIYASQPVPAADIRIWAQEWNTKSAGEEPMAIAEDVDTGGVGVVAIDPYGIGSEPIILLAALPPVADLPDEIPHGNIDEDPISSPCDEYVLPFAGQGTVRVATPCIGWGVLNSLPDPENLFVPPPRLPTPVSLPLGVLVTNAHLFDLDTDGHLDLLIDSNQGLYAAYGRGDMTFDSAVDADLLLPADNTAAPFWFQPWETLLAVGHIDDDGIVDFVTTNGIWLTVPHWVGPEPGQGGGFGVGGFGGGVVVPAGGAGGADGGHMEISPARVVDLAGAVDALIGDFNANGIGDVAVSLGDPTAAALPEDPLTNSRYQNIYFYNGAGDGLFNPFVLPTEGPVTAMTTGDFDGDVVPDIVISEAPPATDQSLGDSLTIAFGQDGASPATPVSMGRLTGIRHIAAARLFDPTTGTVDGISEVAIVTREGADFSYTVLYGSTDRQLQSPFALSIRQGAAITSFSPLRSAIAEFSATAGHPDLALLAAPPEWVGPRLWLAEAEGDAALDQGSTWPSEPLSMTDAMLQEAVMGAVDIDGDGISEVVGFVPIWAGQGLEGALVVATAEAGEAAGSRVFVTHVLDGRSDEVFGEHPLTVPVYFGGAAEGAQDAFLSGGSQQRVVVADVDGDGWLDLVVIGTSWDDTLGIQTRAVIFWHSGSSDPVTAYSMATRTSVPDVPGGVVNAVTSVEVDGDAGRELVLVTPDRALLVDVTAERAILQPRLLEGVVGGEAVAAADFDGDGIEDLAVADAVRTAVYLQRAGNP